MVPGVPAAVLVAEGAGDDPAAGCADRTGSASVVVAQTEMALPGAGVRAEGVHRVAARGHPGAGPDHHQGPPGGGASRSAITCRPVSGVAAEMGMDWRIAHDAFVAYADEVLPDGPPPVRVLGIDETRRGKGRYEVETSTGVKVWVDRFDTGLVDLDGTGGLFAQVNGRNSAAVIAWLEEQDPDWRAAITHVSMDTSATYARAARLALPHAIGHRRSVPPGGAREPGGHRVPAGTGLGAPRPAGPEGRPGMGAAEPVAPRRRVPHRGGVREDARRDARRGPVRWAREMLAGKGNAPPTARAWPAPTRTGA